MVMDVHLNWELDELFLFVPNWLSGHDWLNLSSPSQPTLGYKWRSISSEALPVGSVDS